MRFIGGKLSKNEGGVTVKTPAGALAIRGGMFQASLSGSRGVFSFLFGNEMRLGSQRVFQPGYTIDTTSGTPTVRPTTAQDINGVMAALTNCNTDGLGATGNEETDVSQGVLQETVSLQDLISDATDTRIDDSLQEDEANTPSGNTPTGTTPPPPPAQVTFRVLSVPGVYDAYGERIQDPASNGILGGGNYNGYQGPAKLADDFTWTFSIVNGRFLGTVSGLKDANCSGPDCQIITTHTASQAKVDLPASFPAVTCLDGICPVTNAKITQDGKTRNYAGVAVLKKDFYAYDVLAGRYVSGKGLVPTDSEEPDRILLFGGKGYKFAEPTGKIYTFQLSNDLLQGDAAGPFASSATSPVPVDGTRATSPLLLLEHDGGAEDTSRAVWLQTTLVVNTDEESESFGQSFINIALGEWSVSGGLSGSRRGGADVDDAYSFSGDIASLAGPDKSHFLGKNSPNLVVGFDSTGNHNIGLDTPLNPIEGENDTVQNQAGSTYHIGVGTGTQVPGSQDGGTFTGYG